MKLNNIDIYNFRNYEKLSLSFENDINIFIGNNGIGKTNLLESIYFLAVTKSHRSYIDKNLITKDREILRIKGSITAKSGKKNLEIIMTQKGKRVSINNVVYKKVSDYISNLNVILFCPDDLDLIKGSPGERRKFLNLEIGQIDNKYLYTLNEYNELIKNRNEYLKTITCKKYDLNYISVINSQIIQKSLILYKYRFMFIENLNKNIQKLYSKISKENIEIKYRNSCDINSYDAEKIKNILSEKLVNNIKKEILQGNTLYGPHKDDFELYIENKNIREYGSQGQQRLSVLLIKMAELIIFNEIKGEYPILLLDDVYSELDITKRNEIMSFIPKNTQVFITSTDVNDISEDILKISKIYKIEKGKVL